MVTTKLKSVPAGRSRARGESNAHLAARGAAVQGGSIFSLGPLRKGAALLPE